MKFKNWNGKDLKGVYVVSLKIDGVHAIFSEDGVLSRHGKPLYNLDHLGITEGNYEVYVNRNFKQSIQAVRTKTLKDDTPRVTMDDMYRLDVLDDGLHIGSWVDPSIETIKANLEYANQRGYEGLILQKKGSDKRIKVKPKETYDVNVIDIQAGKGKHEGRMGAVITPRGKVGTGFTDADREEDCVIGDMIEVECMGIFPDTGKFRHPRFIRRRLDK